MNKVKISVLLLANFLGIILLLYMLDVFGVVNYYTFLKNTVYPKVPFIGTENYINELEELESREIDSIRTSFLEKEKDIEILTGELDDRSMDIDAREEELEEEKDRLALEKQSYSNDMNNQYERDKIIEGLASTWNNMPPENTRDIVIEMSNDDKDQLILDVFLKMDNLAAAGGSPSITSYLYSLLPPDISARLQQKYENRAN